MALINGTHIRGHHHLLEPTGSVYVHPYDYLLEMCSGTFHGLDKHINTGERESGNILWKCKSCMKVYRLEDTLECDSCGQPITEDSRFILR